MLLNMVIRSYKAAGATRLKWQHAVFRHMYSNQKSTNTFYSNKQDVVSQDPLCKRDEGKYLTSRLTLLPVLVHSPRVNSSINSGFMPEQM